MANKDMERLVISGLDANNYILTPDTTLSKDGVPADAGAVGDALEEVSEDIDALKEDLSTLNSEGTVPTSEQMLSDNYSEDSVPYHFRRTASDNADREELEIVGGSVAWNQLIENGNFADTSKWSNNAGTGAFTASDNVASLTPPSSRDNYAQQAIEIIEGHKYLYSIDARALDNSTSKAVVRIYYGSSADTFARSVTDGSWHTLSGVFEGVTGTIKYFRLVNNTAETTHNYKNCVLFDLTAMFGSTIADHIYSLEQATAGAGVALFKSLFNKDFYPYDTGSMQSVSGLSEHVTVGFNQWDEEWESGIYNPSTGAKQSYSTCIRSKNLIPVFPNTEYYVNAPKNIIIVSFDADKNYIGNPYNNKNTTYTTSARVRYIGFYTESTTYSNDICINLSDPAKNGQYEPYDGHSYALDDSLTLRGIPTLVDGKIKWDGDIYCADGKVMRRYGIVDLGTLTWTYNADYHGFYASKPQSIKSYSRTDKANAVCTKYPVNTYAEIAENHGDKSIGIGSSNIIIGDSSYTDAATFKTAMSGVYLVYELATPTAEQADPYVSPQTCSPYGTEEFVSTGIVPVGHNTKYPDNLRKKLDNLPWNFANLIAPTESGFKATRNYTTGALLIVNNTLYKATANIANGGTITPNTNVTATTLAEIIAALS